MVCNENVNANINSNNIIFTIKCTKLFVAVVNLSAKDNHKPSKLLSKEFARSVSWNECKTKVETKNKINEYRYILKSNFVTDCLFWFIQTEMTMLKNIIYQRYY